MRSLHAFAAGVEILTGAALIATPSLTAQLLLGAELSGVAVPVARLAGVGLLSLGIACLPGKNAVAQPASLAILAYNALVALLLIAVGVQGEWAGVLLWPAVALHVALTGLLARDWLARTPQHF
jgi:hypothetical protein